MPWPSHDGNQPPSGHGEIHLALLPPATPSFKTLRYSYPLKLVPSSPHILPPDLLLVKENASSSLDGGALSQGKSSALPRPASVPLLFMLSYGGGLLPPDALSLTVTLDPGARLTLATQGSTKIFPTPSAASTSTSSTGSPALHSHESSISSTQHPRPSFTTASQSLHAHIARGASLLLAPDPVQPFARSRGKQYQRFDLAAGASVAVLDWVAAGRPARGESWRASCWRSCNEIWRVEPTPSGSSVAKERLLLRDAVLLGDDAREVEDGGVGQRLLRDEGIGVMGSLILAGKAFERLGDFFVEEFGAMPRIGGRDWGDDEGDTNGDGTPFDKSREERKRRHVEWRKERLKHEKQDHVLWTAARVRGVVLVKVSAREVEGARRFLREMWMWDGTIGNEFGDGGLMCVK